MNVDILLNLLDDDQPQITESTQREMNGGVTLAIARKFTNL